MGLERHLYFGWMEHFRDAHCVLMMQRQGCPRPGGDGLSTVLKASGSLITEYRLAPVPEDTKSRVLLVSAGAGRTRDGVSFDLLPRLVSSPKVQDPILLLFVCFEVLSVRTGTGVRSCILQDSGRTRRLSADGRRRWSCVPASPTSISYPSSPGGRGCSRRGSWTFAHGQREASEARRRSSF